MNEYGAHRCFNGRMLSASFEKESKKLFKKKKKKNKIEVDLPGSS